MRLRPRGLSMIEVMVGLGVFITAFLMCVGIFPTASRAVAQARSQEQAMRLAESELERLAALPFASVTSGLRTVQGDAVVIGGRKAPEEYSIQTTVTQTDTDLKRVNVLVSWSAQMTHFVRLETYRANLQ